MRFKKGSKVEVMNRNEVPISWRCAEIISGNGHTYSVRYDCNPGLTNEVVVERVSRKTIRPCPIPVEGVESWVAGDIVETYDDISWKITTVLKVLGGDYYLVRILGFSREFRVHKSNIRVRQSWEDDKWVVIGKGSGSCGDVKNNLSTLNCHKKVSLRVAQDNTTIKLQEGDDCFAVRNNAGLQESHIVSSRTLKRPSPYCSSVIEAYTGDIQKVRAIEKEGRRQRVVPSPLLEKVDAVAYPRENLGEKYMHSSFNNRSNGYYEMERIKQNGVVGCSLARSSESNDSDSDACSVGSCTGTSSPKKFSSRFVAIPCQDTDTLCSDAESFYGSGDEDENCPLPPEEEVAASIHRLELHAYHCTLEALYASGPLSWEQEALLTNLRITLHISNDEHLMEVRNLISAGTGIHIS
uniref:ENT domain-containing protein n=1 Tax=Davidia involucrata TaxID=16924 RepID=A0A5B7AJ30_DAVIN